MNAFTNLNSAVLRPLGNPGDLIVDCDGVLLDWVAGFAQFIFQKTGKKLDPKGPSQFKVKTWLGVDTDEEAAELVTQFNQGDCGAFSRLPPLKGASDALRLARNSGRQVHVITACSKDQNAIDMRKENLCNVFGDVFKTIICIDLLECKAPYLAKFAPGIWVEDKFENALKGAQQGHASFLIRASHNRHIEARKDPVPFQWVDGWEAISSHL